RVEEGQARRSTVFPAPEGPTTASRSPGLRTRLTSRISQSFPFGLRLPTPLASMTGAGGRSAEVASGRSTAAGAGRSSGVVTTGSSPGGASPRGKSRAGTRGLRLSLTPGIKGVIHRGLQFDLPGVVPAEQQGEPVRDRLEPPPLGGRVDVRGHVGGVDDPP